MHKFRKKPVEVEAFQMTVERRWNNVDWPEWMNKAWNEDHGGGAIWPHPGYRNEPGYESPMELAIGTQRGIMTIHPGDWIIKNANGEIYKCDPGVFTQTYEPAE